MLLVVCVIATLPVVAIPELAKATVTGVPSGSVTVYVISTVKCVAVGRAVVDDKEIDGAVFTNVILYQPEPFDIYNAPVDVVYAKLPADDIGLNGKAAGFA